MTDPTRVEMIEALNERIAHLEYHRGRGPLGKRLHELECMRAVLRELEAGDRILVALSTRILDSRRSQDPRVVVIGFTTPAEALEFHEAISVSPPGTSDRGGE